jgi:ribosome-associated heat shock protein Hsp15
MAWHARFCKSRAHAQAMAEAGHIRLNGNRVEKPGIALRPGAVLTLPVHRTVLVVRVLALGQRRGPAAEARTLYGVLSGPEPAPSLNINCDVEL